MAGFECMRCGNKDGENSILCVPCEELRDAVYDAAMELADAIEVVNDEERFDCVLVRIPRAEWYALMEARRRAKEGK